MRPLFATKQLKAITTQSLVGEGWVEGTPARCNKYYCVCISKQSKEVRRVSLVWNKTPKIEPQPTSRGKADYERLFHLAKEVLKGVRTKVFIPNRGCWMCKDCEFAQDCREWK